MDVLKQLTRRASAADNLGIAFFAIAAVYALVRGTWRTILAGVAFFLMILGALPRQSTLAFLVGASVILLLQTRGGAGYEGFTDASGEPVAPPAEEKEETLQ